MSRIAGIYQRDQSPVNRAALEQMAVSLQGHGSDAAVLWQSGSCGLATCLFRTTPQSNYARLPFVSTDELFVISADVRLDNRRELLGYFDFSGTPAAHVPDSALIVEAYKRWGERCVDRLLGAFSFALWDVNQRKLFCARDHMGIRPFYYAQVGQTFYFASEIKGLLALPDIDRTINDAKLLDFLLWEYRDKSASFYRDILRLPPAHTLSLTAEGLRLHRYWELDSEYELEPRSDAEYAEQFLDIFTEAVGCRLQALSPVGSMLSGGLDSSAVTCVARAALGETSKHPLSTFSAVFPGLPEVDESRYIACVLDQGGMKPYYLRADQFGPLGDVTAALQRSEEPHPFPHLGMVSRLLQMARESGVRVVLDGTDGDAAVSHGLGVLRQMAYQGQWDQFAATASALGQNYQAYDAVNQRLLEGYGYSGLTQLIRDGHWLSALRAIPQISQQFQRTPRSLVGGAVVAPLILRPLRQRRRGSKPPPDIAALLAPDFAQRFDFAERQRALRQGQVRPVRTDRQEQVNLLNSAWLTEALDALDKTGAARGVELRHPFFDKRLIEFCVALPVSQKIDGGWTRVILRRALQGVLPSEIQWRASKSNLEPSFRKSFLAYDRPRIEHALLDAPALLEPYLNIPALQASYRGFVEKPTASVATRLWSATQLWYWLDQVAHQPKPSAGFTRS